MGKSYKLKLDKCSVCNQNMRNTAEAECKDCLSKSVYTKELHRNKHFGFRYTDQFFTKPSLQIGDTFVLNPDILNHDWIYSVQPKTYYAHYFNLKAIKVVVAIENNQVFYTQKITCINIEKNKLHCKSVPLMFCVKIK